MKAPDEGRPLVFIHIPKTGGVSVRNLITTRFAGDEILWIKSKADLPPTNEALGRFRLITGHFPYDMIVPRCPTPPHVVAFLRHPVDRALSNAFYLRWFVENAPEPEAVKASDRMIAAMSVEEFAQSDDPSVIFLRDNIQSRLLSPLEGEWGIDCIGKESIEHAKARLEEMLFVGIVERMTSSVAMLSDLIGLPFPGSVPRLNPTTRRQRMEEVDPEVIETLTRKNQVDMELYRFADDLFQERFAVWLGECLEERHRARLSTPDPPRSVRIPFGGPVDGWGWYMPVNNAFRWSGPSPRSFVDLHVATEDPLVLRFEVSPHFNRDLADHLRVYANGHPVLTFPQPSEPGKQLYEGPVPEAARMDAGNVLRIAFEVPKTRRPCDVLEGNRDPSPVGLAFWWLEVGPG